MMVYLITLSILARIRKFNGDENDNNNNNGKQECY